MLVDKVGEFPHPVQAKCVYTQQGELLSISMIIKPAYLCVGRQGRGISTSRPSQVCIHTAG